MSDAERAEFIATIREQGERLAQMVDKLLALAAVEHRQRIDAPRELDVRALLGEAASDFAAQARSAGVALVVEDVAAGAQVAGDGFLLRQAIGNLLDNAIGFSPAGGEVRMSAGIDGNALEIRVRDRGPGIPDYAEARVFERFYSLPRRSGGSRGSGLGLPFVAEVAALHGGSARLENAPGGGTIACLRLPLSRG